MRCVTQVKAARGTIVAIIGMRASCQPIPVLVRVAPAAATTLPSATILPIRKIENILKTKFILMVLACCSLPAGVYAEVYKCKNADGKLSYTDQECPGSTTTPAAPKTTSTPATIPTSKREERTATTHQKSEPKKPTYYPRSSDVPYPPMSQQEKDKWRALAKDMDKKYDTALTELTQSCKRGDAKACKETACLSLDRWRGPVEDFIYCAKARGLTHGSYWVITSGQPDPDPQNDRHLLDAALTPRLPAGRHVSSTMDLMCFRKNSTRADPLADRYRIEKILYVAKGANGPLLTQAFSQDFYGPYRTKTMPEYKTLEEAIDKTCEK